MYKFRKQGRVSNVLNSALSTITVTLLKRLTAFIKQFDLEQTWELSDHGHEGRAFF
ncbi:MAG TPA: hypothetical protein VEA59_00090 [Patescibacteria group bacterium]|nr:hypothetical protein [Patescibacteria group bacterium]